MRKIFLVILFWAFYSICAYGQYHNIDNLVRLYNSDERFFLFMINSGFSYDTDRKFWYDDNSNAVWFTYEGNLKALNYESFDKNLFISTKKGIESGDYKHLPKKSMDDNLITYVFKENDCWYIISYSTRMVEYRGMEVKRYSIVILKYESLENHFKETELEQLVENKYVSFRCSTNWSVVRNNTERGVTSLSILHIENGHVEIFEVFTVQSPAVELNDVSVRTIIKSVHQKGCIDFITGIVMNNVPYLNNNTYMAEVLKYGIGTSDKMLEMFTYAYYYIFIKDGKLFVISKSVSVGQKMLGCFNKIEETFIFK